ncbi:MAG: DUF4258 domain-containing protein [Candidatus Margulisbacteria bacterium]|nr:DUF4258 domain-containing protein [Candidatus Margulisiibacteriota bacterium]
MKVDYSEHILLRMKERKISREDIEAIINTSVETVILPSKTDVSVILILGYVGKKDITVIMNRLTNKLITVRRMQKKERKLFKEVE